MSKFIMKNKIILVILILLAFWGVTSIASPQIEKQNIIPIYENQKTQTVNPIIEKTAEQKKENKKNTEDTESITILAGDTTVQLLFTSNTLFYDALVREKELGKIEFSGKNYPGLGFFVTDIGTLHAGAGKDLLYYVNGKEATVGVSAYRLKDSDIIEWKLE